MSEIQITNPDACILKVDEQAGERASGSLHTDCSAARSADEWAIVGRKAANLAIDAVESGNHGTAEEHRKTAMMAFEMEVRLRNEPPNAPGKRPGGPKKETL